MDSSKKQLYRFAEVEVDVSRGCVVCENKENHLRLKSFQVLIYLLEHHQRLVSKEELMRAVWTDTAVTDDVLVQCVKEIRRAIGDSSHHPRFIKTVPKSGYRFISPVEQTSNGFTQIEEITRVEIEFEEDSETPHASRNVPLKNSEKNDSDLSKKRRLIFTAFLLLLGLSAIAIYFSQNRRAATQTEEIRLPQLLGKRAVVVTYFENQSKTAELDWLREGLADMLITDLSRSPNLTVLSRGQLYQFIERLGRSAQDNQLTLEETLEIARRANAETIVTGSFAGLGARIRINVQLHDVRSGQLNAAETLIVENAEQILTDIDLLSLKLINRLGASKKTVGLGETMTKNLEAYRYYSLGVEQSQAFHIREAIELFEKAVALDPEFAMAHARIGYAYAVSWGYPEEGKPHLERAFQLSARLTEKDRLSIAAWYAIANLDFPAAIRAYREMIAKYPLENEAYWSLARLLDGEGKTEEAVVVLRQGLTVDPEDKNLYNVLGGFLSALGRHDEALAARRRYATLAPDEPNAHDSVGLVHQWAGNYDAAIENYNRALELKPDFEIALIHLANTRFQLGQYRAALNLFLRYIEIAPSDGERVRGLSGIFEIQLKLRDFAAAEKTAAKIRAIRRETVWESLRLALERGDKKKTAEFEPQLFAQTRLTNRGARNTQRFNFYYRGFIALKNGKADEAINNFREALRQPPPVWHIDPLEDSLATALIELGRPDEAITEYERILRLNPNYPLARFHLAQAFQQKDLPDQARQYCRQFLEAWKNADEDIPEVIICKREVKR